MNPIILFHLTRLRPQKRIDVALPATLLLTSTHRPCCVCASAEWATELLDKMGPRFAGPIAIIRNWTYCLFYVMAEL